MASSSTATSVAAPWTPVQEKLSPGTKFKLLVDVTSTHSRYEPFEVLKVDKDRTTGKESIIAYSLKDMRIRMWSVGDFYARVATKEIKM